MAGGIGSRFWPFSRTKYPKQFHDMLGTGKTLLQHTAERFKNICPTENILVVTNKIYKDLVLQQLPYIKEEHLLLEPIGKNTAPCIAYACYKIAQKNPLANIVVAPSDHIILNEYDFEKITLAALERTAKDNVLLTLGIRPSRPDTGYGYIQYDDFWEGQIKKVKTFTEKPHLELAQKFLESGEFLWNAGIFIWSVATILKSFRELSPEMADIFEEGTHYYYGAEEFDFLKKAYGECKNISIDYAILEKASNVFVIPADFGWSDLGTWKSLHEISYKDENNNVIGGNVIAHETQNCIVKTSEGKLIVVQGLDGYIVANFEDALIICKMDEEQRVKDFVSEIKSTFEGKFI